ncbi:MAG: hypothetical protein P1U58_02535 [Verrucomicrobiales bacterium]|nr:hypothetical protein [Verrucomicrobiales bacterium]
MIGAGCKTTGNKEGENEAAATEETPEMKIPVGSLHVVRQAEKFVLIRSARIMSIEPGSELVVVASDGAETAKLRVSPARKGEFVTADIISGMPQVGDKALMNYAVQRQSANKPAEFGVSENEIQVLE